jgi:hypothetical protein
LFSLISDITYLLHPSRPTSTKSPWRRHICLHVCLCLLTTYPPTYAPILNNPPSLSPPSYSPTLNGILSLPHMSTYYPFPYPPIYLVTTHQPRYLPNPTFMPTHHLQLLTMMQKSNQMQIFKFTIVICN